MLKDEAVNKTFNQFGALTITSYTNNNIVLAIPQATFENCNKDTIIGIIVHELQHLLGRIADFKSLILSEASKNVSAETKEDVQNRIGSKSHISYENIYNYAVKYPKMTKKQMRDFIHKELEDVKDSETRLLSLLRLKNQIQDEINSYNVERKVIRDEVPQRFKQLKDYIKNFEFAIKAFDKEINALKDYSLYKEYMRQEAFENHLVIALIKTFFTNFKTVMKITRERMESVENKS